MKKVLILCAFLILEMLSVNGFAAAKLSQTFWKLIDTGNNLKQIGIEEVTYKALQKWSPLSAEWKGKGFPKREDKQDKEPVRPSVSNSWKCVIVATDKKSTSKSASQRKKDLWECNVNEIEKVTIADDYEIERVEMVPIVFVGDRTEKWAYVFHYIQKSESKSFYAAFVLTNDGGLTIFAQEWNQVRVD